MTPDEERRYDQAFWLDLENWVLQHRWDARAGIPCGPRRHLDSAWRTIMLQELEDYPRNTIQEYEAFVLSGHGDEWFQEEEQDSIAYRSNAPSDYFHIWSSVNGEPTANIRRHGSPGCQRVPECCAAQGCLHYAGGG